MRTEIIVSGFGGQGIVAAGRTIAYAGMEDGQTVSMLPSYGPEMRGGFANCHTILSDADIASPLASEADAVLAMSMPAMERFQSKVKPGKALIVDSSHVNEKERREDIRLIRIPASQIAAECGNIKFANVVMIGAMMAAIGMPSLQSMEKAIREMLPKSMQALFPLEMKALNAGIDFVKQERMES